jgi:type I restriction enzyme S subunit
VTSSEQLPAGWDAAPILDLLDGLEGGQFLHQGWSPQCEKEASPADDVWGVLKTTAIQDGLFLPRENKRLPKDLAPKPLLEVKEGDLLVTCAGPRARCGVACLVRGTRPRLMISGKMYRFRVSPEVVSPAYLEGYLRSKAARVSVDRMKTGISDSGLNLTQEKFSHLPVPLAPISEQRRIVDKIEELFSDLDAGIEALEHVKSKLATYKAAIMQAAVSGRLTQKWRDNHPDLESGAALLGRAVQNRRETWESEQLAAYAAKGQRPPEGWRKKFRRPEHCDGMFELPRNWTWASALEICESVENGSTPQADQMFPETGEVPFIKVYNLTRNGRLDFTVKPTFIGRSTHEGLLKRSRVRPGDVLMNIVGPPLGKISLVPDDHPEWNINQAVVVFRASSMILPEYLAACLLAKSVLDWITRTAQATAGQYNLSVSNSRRLPLPIPPMREQVEIVRLVSELTSDAEAVESSTSRGLAHGSVLRQSILAQAYSGKLVPQDPTDEAASVLLERIRAERAANAAVGPVREPRAAKKPAKSGKAFDLVPLPLDLPDSE